MDTITICVGNRTLLLSAQEADDIRRILQLEYVKKCINSVIDDYPECFHFTSEKNRSRFVSELANNYDDMIDIWGCYEENLVESVFHHARETGVGVGI